MLRAVIKSEELYTCHVIGDLGMLLNQRELPTKGVRQHLRLYVKPMLLFWLRVLAGSLLLLKSFDHTAFCPADNNEFVILGFVLPKSAWIGGRYSEFRGGHFSKTFKHRGIWLKNPSAKTRSQFRGGPISWVVIRRGPTVGAYLWIQMRTSICYDVQLWFLH